MKTHVKVRLGSSCELTSYLFIDLSIDRLVYHLSIYLFIYLYVMHLLFNFISYIFFKSLINNICYQQLIMKKKEDFL